MKALKTGILQSLKKEGARSCVLNMLDWRCSGIRVSLLSATAWRSIGPGPGQTCGTAYTPRAQGCFGNHRTLDLCVLQGFFALG